MTTNPNIPLISRAELLVVELQHDLLEFDARNRSNLGVNLERIARLAEVRDDLISTVLAEFPLLIGEGNRVVDRLDRADARLNARSWRVGGAACWPLSACLRRICTAAVWISPHFCAWDAR